MGQHCSSAAQLATRTQKWENTPSTYCTNIVTGQIMLSTDKEKNGDNPIVSLAG